MRNNGTVLKRIGVLLLAWLLASAPCLAGARAEATQADAAAQYEAAQALFDAGEYEKALEAFESLGDYEDSRDRAAISKRKWKSARYNEAEGLYRDGQYREAQAIFEALDDYESSRSYVNECAWRIAREDYLHAKELFAAGDYEGALAIFESVGGFSDSEERAQAARDQIAAQKQAEVERECYERGMALKQAGDLEAARDAFIEAGDCQDATAQLYEVVNALTLRGAYEKARGNLDSGAYESAYHLFLALEEYENSAELAAQAKEGWLASVYGQAAALREENPARAYLLLLSLDGYEDSAALAEGLRETLAERAVYEAADALEQEGLYDPAMRGFEALSAYEDSPERASLLKETVAKSRALTQALCLGEVGQRELANEMLRSLEDFQNASLHIWPVANFSTKQLRDDQTTPKSDVFTAPDGTKHRYQIFKGVRTWKEAKVFCEVLGGHLATLTTDEENQFVYRFMRDSGYLTAYFGLSDEKRRGDWIWVTGEPFEYANWHRGEPSRSGRERYGMYFYKHTDGTWNDSHFYEDAEVDPGCSYICEWDE